MIRRVYLFLILLLVLPDLYIDRNYLRHAKRQWLRWLYWMPTLILGLSATLLLLGDNFTQWRTQATALFFIAYLTLTIPKCLFTLCSLLGWCVTPIVPHRNRTGLKKVTNAMALLVAFLGAYIILYGSIWGWRAFQVNELTFSHSQIPTSFDGYRIVQLSDLHIGTIKHYPQEVKRMVEMINSLEPDLIVFTGDLVNNEASELDGTDTLLSRLRATDGVFSVLGNHDYGLYRHWRNEEEKRANLQALKQRQQEMGWRLLLNESHTIRHGNDSITLIGVENSGEPPFPAYGDLPKAMQEAEAAFKILLSHDPTHWRREVIPDTDIQLTLSGHTHAMQFKIGNFSPSAWIYPEWGGAYNQDGQTLYINQGIGSVMIPYRFGAWPEITLLTLKAYSGK